MAWADDMERVSRQERARLVSWLQRRWRFSREDAEEVAQETFLKMLAYSHYFDGRVTAATLFWFARGVARNTVRDRNLPCRRAALLPGKLADDLPEPAIAPVGDARLRLEELRNRLQAADWNALVMAAEGESYQEIAGRFRISMPAMKSLLFRARRKARAAAV